MIFPGYCKPIAKKAIDQALNQYPAIVSEISQGSRWETFNRLLADRCNQLELAKLIPNKPALHKFIEDAAIQYASRYVEKRLGTWVEPKKTDWRAERKARKEAAKAKSLIV